MAFIPLWVPPPVPMEAAVAAPRPTTVATTAALPLQGLLTALHLLRRDRWAVACTPPWVRPRALMEAAEAVLTASEPTVVAAAAALPLQGVHTALHLLRRDRWAVACTPPWVPPRALRAVEAASDIVQRQKQSQTLI